MLQSHLSVKYTGIFFGLTCVLYTASCSSNHFTIQVPKARSERITGSRFFKTALAYNWRQRDSFALKEILSGNIPSFLKKFVPVKSEIVDSLGKNHTAIMYVMPDYISIGTDEDWARVPLTPMAAQPIADRLQCFLPTKKMVDLIWQQAIIKTEPVPMYAFRDSTITMWQHHLIIEGQRKNRQGLIAGIKKDVVLSGRLLTSDKPGRVAIYGWHLLKGKPIQPLYTGHVNWYVDYSHGIRLIYRVITIDGNKMDYIDVLRDPLLHGLLCDEDRCDFFRYNIDQDSAGSVK